MGIGWFSGAPLAADKQQTLQLLFRVLSHVSASHKFKEEIVEQVCFVRLRGGVSR